MNPLISLPILFTRWGRVGEEGQHQETPFPTVELACKEFCQIFKAKSGNNWETQRTAKTFEPKPNKYRLVFKKAGGVSALLLPLDKIISQATDSHVALPPVQVDEAVQNLVKSFCDVSLIHQLVREMGYGDDNDEDDIVSKLSRGVLDEGHEKLQRIIALIPSLKLVDAQLKQQYQLKQHMELQIEQRARVVAEKQSLTDSTGSVSMEDDSEETSGEAVTRHAILFFYDIPAFPLPTLQNNYQWTCVTSKE